MDLIRLGIHDEYTARNQLRSILGNPYEMEQEDVDFVLSVLSRFPRLASQKVTVPGSKPVYPLYVLIRTAATEEEVDQVFQLYPDAVLANPEVEALVKAGCDPSDVPSLWGHNATLQNTKLRINSNFQSLSTVDVEGMSPLFPQIQSFTCDVPMGLVSPWTMASLCSSLLDNAKILTKLQLDVPHSIFKPNTNARTAFVELLTNCPLNHLQLYCDNELEDLDETSNETTLALAEAIQSRTIPIAFVRLQWFFLTCSLANDSLFAILSAENGAKRLHCTDLHIVCPPVEESSNQYMNRNLEVTPSLKEFHLSGECSLPMKPLLSKLALNPTLKEVDIPSELYDYQTQDEAAPTPITNEVVALIQNCPRLEKLRLSAHTLPTDLLCVAPLLASPTNCLKELQVSTSNDVEYKQTERQLLALVSLLETNTTLTTCKVMVKEWGNTIRAYLERIEYCALLNRAGRNLVGDPELTAGGLVDLLLQSIKCSGCRMEDGKPSKKTLTRKQRRKIALRKNSVCYDFLRTNPAVWVSR